MGGGGWVSGWVRDKSLKWEGVKGREREHEREDGSSGEASERGGEREGERKEKTQ